MFTTKSAHGPHGGPLVETDGGLIELSVFETGVPPRFRLYFYDRDTKPLALPKDTKIALETTRPNGARQIFAFKPQADYLEATEELPEPHEFDVRLEVVHHGHSHSYSSRFTEEGHSHGNGHEHHDHGDGFLGRLRGLFGHSHDAADKIDAAMESHALGIRTLKVTLIIMGLTALLQLGIVLMSGSAALLADTIHNFADALTSLPLWLAFALARRGATRRFTYGYGKLEDVAGVVIVLIILSSACVAAYESVLKLLHPAPMEHLRLVTAASIIGFIGNEWVALYRIRVGKEIGSAALVADGYHARVDGFTSLAVLLGVVGSWAGYPIVDPLVGIGITIAILLIVKDAAKSVWLRLIDGIEPEILAEIESAPATVPGVNAVREIRARWQGHRVHAELIVEVDPGLSLRQADGIARHVELALRERVRLLGGAVVRVAPAAATD